MLSNEIENSCGCVNYTLDDKCILEAIENWKYKNNCPLLCAEYFYNVRNRQRHPCATRSIYEERSLRRRTYRLIMDAVNSFHIYHVYLSKHVHFNTVEIFEYVLRNLLLLRVNEVKTKLIEKDVIAKPDYEQWHRKTNNEYCDFFLFIFEIMWILIMLNYLRNFLAFTFTPNG